MQSVNMSLLLLAFMLSGPVANADDVKHSDIEVTLVQTRVIQKDGTDTLSTIDEIAPGDVIQYQATYRNTTQQAVNGLKADLPIPKNTSYVMGSAHPAGVLASTDGATYALPPLKQKIRNANGAYEEYVVPVSEYRHLRWELGELRGGKQVEVSARVRVNP